MDDESNDRSSKKRKLEDESAAAAAEESAATGKAGDQQETPAADATNDVAHAASDGEPRNNNTDKDTSTTAKDMLVDTKEGENGPPAEQPTKTLTENVASPSEAVKDDGKSDNPLSTDKDNNSNKTSTKNPYDSIRYCIVTNDGKPDSLVKLVGLKSLFAKQLPKMPRPYIARLVFDRRHKSLAILSDDPQHKGGDEEIIGGICYRGFPEMRFAEIAFCAVNASQQVKGYGTKLMNLLKRHAVTEGIEYFITYADNYAIGYFKKQGFTKSIQMPKGRFNGLIKDYDGANMMECYVHPSVDFTRIPEMIASQRKFILDRVKTKAKSHRVVYPPLPPGFAKNTHLEGVSRGNEAAARAMAIPGVAEAGWTMADLLASTGGAKDADRQKNALKSELLALVRKTEEQQFAWPFREPVDTSEVQDYLEVVKEPIDLSTIEKRIRKADYYKSKQMLYADLMLMVNNCKLYNDEASTYYECAVSLQKFLGTLFEDK